MFVTPSRIFPVFLFLGFFAFPYLASGSSQIFFNSHDHLNSSALITDPEANVVERITYGSFGSVISDVGTHTEQRKYTGHELDPVTDYTYAGARYLNTDFGRFLSQDPESRDNPEQFLKDPQQLNTYSYARNNPLIFVDRSGRKVELAARPAVGERFLHFFYIVTPDNPGAIDFTGVPKGTEQFTIGGYICPCGGIFSVGNKLSPDTGYSNDPTENGDLDYLLGDKPITDKISIISAVPGQSDTDFINSLGKAYDEIKGEDPVSYFGFGQLGKSNYANSNNFTYELASKVGISSQVGGFNPQGLNVAPGQYGGYPNTSALQYIQQ